MIKIIGIGVAVMVLNEINDKIKKLDQSIEITCNENDYMYCLEGIDKEDVVIIVDSSLRGDIPGTVTVTFLNQFKRKKVYSSKYHVSLPDLISKHHDGAKIYTIGIEVDRMDYLSDLLRDKFDKVCSEVFENISQIVKGIKNE